jgi:hypothetical protein
MQDQNKPAIQKKKKKKWKNTLQDFDHLKSDHHGLWNEVGEEGKVGEEGLYADEPGLRVRIFPDVPLAIDAALRRLGRTTMVRNGRRNRAIREEGDDADTELYLKEEGENSHNQHKDKTERQDGDHRLRAVKRSFSKSFKKTEREIGRFG